MKQHLFRLLLASIAFLLMAACANSGFRSGRTINDLNKELSTLYYMKKAAETAGASGDLVFTDSPIVDDLSALAGRAQAEAKKASNPLIAISLYRIAAVAAWQAGSIDVINISLTGRELCEQGDEGRDAPPRDCGMLFVIPDIAASDTLSYQLDALRAGTRGVAQGQGSGEDKSKARKFFDKFIFHFRGLHGRQNIIAATGVTQKFKAVLHGRIFTVICNSEKAKLLLRRLAGANSPIFKEADEISEAAKSEFGEAVSISVCP